MAEEHARSIARVAAGQLAEIAGYEAVQESSVEILSDLLLRYLAEVSTGAHAYAETAARSDVNVNDVLLSIEDMGTNVEELAAYHGSLTSVRPQGGLKEALGRPMKRAGPLHGRAACMMHDLMHACPH